MVVPENCVVDTNVPVVANGRDTQASVACTAASARALLNLMRSGKLFVDDGGEIVTEYRRRLRARGEPGPGDAFLKWVMTNEWSSTRVKRVPITRSAGGKSRYDEFLGIEGIVVDPSDEKFLAVARAAKMEVGLLQALDSKWWGWRAGLALQGIEVVFLCEAEIRLLYEKKLSSG